MDDFYTLISFSQRSAVFAMRDRGTEHIVDGLTAMAMIEQDRIDCRDALGTLSLLHHAARAIRLNTVELFGKAAALAEKKMSELILGFLKRSEDGRDRLGDRIVPTNIPSGPNRSGPGADRETRQVRANKFHAGYRSPCPLAVINHDRVLESALT